MAFPSLAHWFLVCQSPISPAPISGRFLPLPLRSARSPFLRTPEFALSRLASPCPQLSPSGTAFTVFVGWTASLPVRYDEFEIGGTRDTNPRRSVRAATPPRHCACSAGTERGVYFLFLRHCAYAHSGGRGRGLPFCIIALLRRDLSRTSFLVLGILNRMDPRSLWSEILTTASELNAGLPVPTCWVQDV